ncbi:LysR family transcriptional regulator [Oceanobacillus saliphilus]|uniref:LysR family transcriptional regulator n=1 Tax=Oceanobacillus saliphilus TaxID=2925834 RepID=UPI00201E489F|nr:LysR family transcriptional regulator [Oceanobacillus saliphilus]
MDTKQLAYFIEVAKQKSFTRAAEVLCLSQPTISKMVKNLETELKVELIDRSAKKIELTVAGEIVLEEGQKILGMIDDLSDLLNDMMNLKKGKLKIGIPPLIGFLFFPKILKGFRDLYPEISIQIVEQGANKLKQAVHEGILDLGVVALPVEDEFDVVPIVKEEMMLFVHASHSLATREKVSLLEVKDESFVHFQDDSTLYQQVIQECKQAGFQPHVSYQSTYWDFITEMIRQNLGITIFPRSLANKVDQRDIKAIPIVDPPIIWRLGIILNKNKYVSYATREMVEYISSSLK